MTVKYWDGSSWVSVDETNIKKYDGNTWVSVSDLLFYDGSEFVSIFPTAVVVDDFEDNDISEYNTDTGFFDTQSSVVKSGTYALEGSSDGDNRELISDSGLDNYPSKGDTYQFYVRHTASDDITFGSFYYQDNDNVYSVQLRGGSTDEIRIGKRVGGNSNIEATGAANISGTVDEWMRGVVDLGDTITFTLYDSTDSQMGEISFTDSGTTLTSGGIRWFVAANQTCYFDNAELI